MTYTDLARWLRHPQIVGNKAIAENKVTGISDKFGPYLN